MTTTLAYPRADQVFTVGDKRDVAFARLFESGVQVDPTSRTIVPTMQLIVDDVLTGSPLNKITATVVDDLVNVGKKVVLARIDATGVAVGRYRWELHQSGTDGDGRAVDYPAIGGYITIVARIANPA